MPKSGFDPQRHQRRNARHNPLGSSKKQSGKTDNASAPASSSSLQAIQEQVGKAAKSSSASDQIVPLLRNLPLPSTPAAEQAAIEVGEKIWSLASVSLLLSPQSDNTLTEIKQNRKLLLSKDIIARLVYALQSDTNVEVRREASGALRNLCVDAGFDVRSELANKGGVDAILGAMRWAANALGFDVDGFSSANVKAQKAGATGATSEMSVDGLDADAEAQKRRELLSKPIEQMNKKEKRHATRLAAALGKSLEQVAGQTLTPADEKVLSDGGMAGMAAMGSTTHQSGPRAEPFISLDAETRKGLLEMSENLATIVWCLCESGGNPFAKLATWRWLDPDLVGPSAAAEIPGQGLAAWLCGSVALGCRAASVLSVSAADGSRPSGSSDTISSLKNEELTLVLDLALASANALCGLTDGGEADFVDGLLGRSTSSGSSGKKKGGKPAKAVVLPPVESLGDQAEGATRRLSQIDRAIALLEACIQTNQTGLDKLKRYVLSQTTMLGVLAAGTLRNIAAAVDSTKAAEAMSNVSSKKKKGTFSSANIFVPTRTEGGEALTLQAYEQTHVLPTLVQLLASVDCAALSRDLEGQTTNEPAAGAEASREELQGKVQVRAEEEAQTLSLAIEVLAEMASGFDRGKSGEADEWQEDLEAEDVSDEEMDEDVGGRFADDDDVPDADGGSDQDEDDKMADDDTFASAVKRGGSLPFENIAPTLCRLFVPFGGSPAIADVLLPLSQPFESSFPSLVSANNGAEGSPASKEAAPALLRAIHVRSLSVLNNALLRLASFSAPPPSQPISDPKAARRLVAFRAWISGEGGAGARLTSTFKSLYEVARGCASVPAVASAAPALSAANGSNVQASSASSAPSANTEQQDGLHIVETCIGSMWSIARCLEGSVPLSWVGGQVINPSSPGSESAELVSAMIASYHTASSDGMKVKAVSLLSTIARAPNVSPQLTEKVAQFLLSILETIPDRPSTSAGGSANAESVVAAINGLIDTFADENSHYDGVFRRGDMLKRCKATTYKCRAVAKTVDRRRFLSLRAMAEEAAENWMAFLDYRQKLKL